MSGSLTMLRNILGVDAVDAMVAAGDELPSVEAASESRLSKLCELTQSAPDAKVSLRDVKKASKPLAPGRNYGRGGASGEFKGRLASRRYWWGTPIADKIVRAERIWDTREVVRV